MSDYPCPKKLNAKIRSKLSDLDTMPFVYRKLLNLLNSNFVSSRDLGRVISTDQSLSIKVLRMVNSAYYGLTQKVMSVSQAVNLLGLNVVRSLCFCLASYDAFFSTQGDAQAQEWAKAMRCGLLAKHLSRRISVGKPEELFIAGVLHDVGFSILKKYASREYKLLRLGSKGSLPDLEKERQLIGTTHAEIGALACQAWKLPELLVSCVRYHHEPESCEEYQGAASLICLASACCRHTGLMGLDISGFPESRYLEELGLTEEDLEQALGQADRERVQMEEFLGVNPTMG